MNSTPAANVNSTSVERINSTSGGGGDTAIPSTAMLITANDVTTSDEGAGMDNLGRSTRVEYFHISSNKIRKSELACSVQSDNFLIRRYLKIVENKIVKKLMKNYTKNYTKSKKK